MNTNQIDCVLFNTCEQYKGCFASDQIPNSGIFVANIAPSNHKGLHWVAFYNNEFFDSYGFAPEVYGFDKMIYNDTTFQQKRTDVCGHYVIMYIFLRCSGISKSDILGEYDKYNLFYNDCKVRDFVRVLINKYNLKHCKIGTTPSQGCIAKWRNIPN